jgi:hypothetical protein
LQENLQAGFAAKKEDSGKIYLSCHSKHDGVITFRHPSILKTSFYPYINLFIPFHNDLDDTEPPTRGYEGLENFALLPGRATEFLSPLSRYEGPSEGDVLHYTF